MTPLAATNGTAILTPDEQRILAQLRELPGEALPLLEDHLDLLTAHFSNPGCPDASTPEHAAKALASEEFQRVVRSLPPAAADYLLEAATFIAGCHLKWSYDDPKSLSVSADLMGLDPFLLRESAAISREFECTLNDGLEPY